jgi:hypothetical protein
VVEQLDDRCVPAVFDVPWADPRHLTLGFAPDGTNTSDGMSNLFQAFGAQLPQSVWQGDILRAVETWADMANINVGVVPDGGQAFGTIGSVQGDGRFGDIRIGGAPMALSTLALSTPPDPFLPGTLAGDILFNTSVHLTASTFDLYSVALHEVGHALGLPENSDPTSVMNGNLRSLPEQLSANDVAAIQALYGALPADPSAVAVGASPLSPATVLVPATPGVASGQVPLVAYGDLTAAGTTDGYSFQVPAGYSGSMTLRVRTAGISLLDPTVSLYDSTGALVASGSVNDPTGGEVVLQVSATTPGATYFVQIAGPAAGGFGIGRYALAVSFDRATGVSSTRLESVLQGPYDTLSGTDLAGVLLTGRPASTPPLHNTTATAIPLATSIGTGALPTYQTLGNLHGEGATDYYQLVAPNSTGPVVLSAAVAGLGSHGARPRVQLFDSSGQPVTVDVMVNDGGTYAIQAVGLTPGQTYYLRVSTGESEQSGGYALAVDFNQATTILSQVSTGQLTTAASTAENTLFVANPAYFRISLSMATGDGEDDGVVSTSPPSIQMTLRDSTGAIVFSLTTGPGHWGASAAVLLAPGQYSVSFTGPATGITQPLNFTVRLAPLSDPIGPQIYDPTSAPLYQSPTNPREFLYPVGVVTENFFLWFPAIF